MKEIKDRLDLLSLAKEFNIDNIDGVYTIEIDNLIAYIENNRITYGITGCYDSGLEVIHFDIQELKKLEKFCNLLIGE